MAVKRAVDIALGTLLAVLALPLIVVLAIGCAIALRAWPIYIQRRVGRNGRDFALPKLRTLRPSVRGDATKYELDATQIPRFCQFLRRTHLDELPQLLVVPIGRMSLVGPRPEMHCLVDRYPAELLALRTRLRPGCTGLWQVSGASQMLIHESPEYDLAYLEHCNARLDFWILYRTVMIGITGRADATLDDVPAWAWDVRVLRGAGSGKGRLHPAYEPVVDLSFFEELEAVERSIEGLRALPIDIEG